MDGKSVFNTDRLTHILIEGAGWIPVDDGRYEETESFDPDSMTHNTETVLFRSDKKTISVYASRIIAFKYAAPSEAKR